jgi:hypothetical protein
VGGDRIDGRAGWLLFAGAAAAAFALILWFGRETTFSVDELVVFMTTPHQGVSGVLQPANGHLDLTTRLVYAAFLQAFGADYLPFRLIAAAMVVTTAALFYAYARRRIGNLAALAPALVLLVFGSDYLHVIAGNGFTIQLALSCGLGALLLLERRDRAGDVVACGLLCVGVASYSVALAFVAGIAVGMLARGQRRRLWVIAVPLALYAIWWLWALGQFNSSGEQVSADNLLELPSWAFQSLSSTLGAISGLDFDFAGGFPELAQTATTKPIAGPALAAMAFAIVLWRAPRPRAAPALWCALTIVVALWIAGTVVADATRPPTSVRYLYPGAVVVLLVAVELLRGTPWRPAGLAVLFAVAAIGAAANLVELRDGGSQRRDSEAPQIRAELGALQVAGGRTRPDFSIGAVVNGTALLTYPFAIVVYDRPPSELYLDAAGEYGGVGFSPEELRARTDEVRARADSFLVAALELQLRPLGPAAAVGSCEPVPPSDDGSVTIPISPGNSVVVESPASAEISIRRFADAMATDLGPLAPATPTLLRVPADHARDPWILQIDRGPVRTCEA